MKAIENQNLAGVRQMAATLNCFIEEDFQVLAGATASTVEAWRKRGTGPSFIRLGSRYLYPHAAVAKHIEENLHERKPRVKALL